MASPSDIYGGLSSEDLLGFQKQVQEGNFPRLLGQSISQAKIPTSTYSPATQGAVSFLQGLLGAGLQQYAKEDEAVQLKAVQSVLPQLATNPSDVEMPEGIDTGAWSVLQGSAKLKQEQRKALLDANNREFENKYGYLQGTPEQSRALAKLFQGQELDVTDADALSTAPYQLRQQAAILKNQMGVQDRFDTKAAVDLSASTFPGFAPATPNAVTPKPSEAASIRARMAATDMVANNLKTIADLPAYSMTGEDVQTINAATGLLYNNLRDYTGSGANLTGKEQMMMEGSIIPSLSTMPLGTVLASLTDRDRQVAASAITKILDASMDAQIGAYGWAPVARPLSEFNTQRFVQRFGAPPALQTMMPGTQNIPNAPRFQTGGAVAQQPINNDPLGIR